MDPTGLEFTATKVFSEEDNKWHININITGVIIDETGQYTAEQMEELNSELIAGIQEFYTGEDDNFVWTMTADIRVVGSEDEIKKKDHVFRIIEDEKLQLKLTKREFEESPAYGLAAIISIYGNVGFGGKVQYVSDKSVPYGKKFGFDLFKEIGSHEFGHGLGLGHSKSLNNLMGPSVRNGNNITGGQINDIYENYVWGRLNLPIQSLPDRRK